MSHTTETPVGASSTPAMKLESAEIQRILPHRYPMLLIDRIVELVRTKSIVAIKNVTANEPFFSGHFPGSPIMPGVLIVEAMAQAGGLLLLTEIPDRDKKFIVFTGIEKARFRRPVFPGDQLRLEVTVLAWRLTAGRMRGCAYVGDKLAAEAVVSCQVVDRERKRREPPTGDGSAPAPPSSS